MENRVQLRGGMDLQVLEAGAGDPVIFLPGWTFSADIWRDQLVRLAATHRAIAVSFRSHGSSAAVPAGNTFAQYAGDVHELMSATGVARATMVGWSYGGSVILEYARQFGLGSLEAIVLVDSLVHYRRSESWKFGFPFEAVAAILAGLAHDRRSFTSGFLRSMFKKTQPESFFEKLIGDSLATPEDTAIALIAHVLTVDYRPMLAELEVPVLFAVQEDAAEMADWLAAHVPDGEAAVFQGCGHCVFHDDPDKFHHVLKEFLDARTRRR